MTLRDIRPPEEVVAMEQTCRVRGRGSGDRLRAVDAHSAGWRRIQVEVSLHTIDLRETGAVSLVQDVTERQLLHQKLVQQAHHDTLTGLPNRLCCWTGWSRRWHRQRAAGKRRR